MEVIKDLFQKAESLNFAIVSYTDHNKVVVIFTTACICGIIFLYNLFFSKEKEKRIAAEIASLFHHILVVILSLLAVYFNINDLPTNSALSITDRFAYCQTIQYINIGYFIYDSVNAITWEHNFILHHAIALCGFLLADSYGRGGLGNALNTLITEIGSIMYNIYNKNKSTKAYIRFVAVYTITRLGFLYWTYLVFLQLHDGLRRETAPKEFIYLIFLFQTLLVIVNLHFLSTHFRKLKKILKKRE